MKLNKKDSEIFIKKMLANNKRKKLSKPEKEFVKAIQDLKKTLKPKRINVCTHNLLNNSCLACNNKPKHIKRCKRNYLAYSNNSDSRCIKFLGHRGKHEARMRW